MNLIPITITFLMLLGIMAYTQTKLTIQNFLGQRMYASWEQCNHASQMLKEKSLLEQLRCEGKEKPSKEEPPPPRPPQEKSETASNNYSVSLGFNLARIPNNARLNFWLLFHDIREKNTSEFSRYEMAASLMRHLYADQEFFKAIPDVEYRILDILIQKKELTAHFGTPDELSSIDMDQPDIQKIFYLMLKGCPSLDDMHPGSSSLLNYISFDELSPKSNNRKKINLLFAAPELLNAVFNNSNLVNKLIELRAQLWKEMFDFEVHRRQLPPHAYLTRTEIREKLLQGFSGIISQEGLDVETTQKLFDFTVGKPGKVLILKDCKTGVCIRQFVSLKR